MTLNEKVAHLKGFLEGMNFSAETNENRIILSIVDILDDMAKDIADLTDDINMLEDYADELDHDLGELEDYIYNGDEDECDCDCCCDDECDCDCDCDCDEEFYEAECPNCGEKVCFDDSIDSSDIICPACNKHFACED